MKTNKQQLRHQASQAGMVSIIVTMIMTIVISLIIVGFAQVARRNQQEALDRQLSSQAFYAAETGINDVVGLISSGGYNYVSDLLNYDSCDTTGPSAAKNFVQVKGLGSKQVLNSAGSVKYTCLMVTPNLNPVHATVSVDSNKVVHMKPKTPINVGETLSFTWTSNNDDSRTADGTNCPASPASGSNANNFTPFTDWKAGCKFGLLRFDLFEASSFDASSPTGSAAAADAASAKTAGAYVVPSNAPAGYTAQATFGQPSVAKASCSSGKCTALIKFDRQLNDFYVRISALYDGLNTVDIGSTDGTTFTGAGVQIDATGKARDVLRRVQVQIQPAGPKNDDAPAYAIASTDSICKRFLITGVGSSASPPGLCRP